MRIHTLYCSLSRSQGGVGRTGMMTGLALALMFAGAGFWLLQESARETSSSRATDLVTEQEGHLPPGSGDVESLENLSPEVVKKEQEVASEAVLDTLGDEPLEAPLASRPAFVSRVEWRVFQSVAEQKAQPQQELARLVNSLRFYKLREHWQLLAEEPQNPRRKALAEQLLEEIPRRVANQELSRDQAHRMQLEILEAHIRDASERNRRAAEEAQRIGVTFDINRS